MNKNGYIIGAVVVCVILVAGTLYAYVPFERYDSKIMVNGNSVEYEISSTRATEYSAILMDNGDFKAVEKIYILQDYSYGAPMDEKTNRESIRDMVAIMDTKHITNIEYVDVDQMYGMLKGEGSGRGLVITAGAIPVNGDIDQCLDSILDWTKKGGSLYWTFDVLGKYISHPGGYEEKNCYGKLINEGVRFDFGGDGQNMDENGICETFKFRSYNIHTAPSRGTVSGNVACFGYTNGDAYSITSIQKEKGQICIISGYAQKLVNKPYFDLAAVISSNLSCFTNLSTLQHQSGTVNGHVAGTMVMNENHGKNMFLYVTLGGWNSVYSAGHIAAS